EFSFMFVAPVLYVLHAVLTGISVFIAASMHWIAGFGFSAGLVDMVLSTRNPLATHWYMLLLQGAVFFVIYYGVFRFTITRFNLMTPGREAAVTQTVSESAPAPAGNSQSMARGYLQAIGGKDNLTGIDACITRLRLSVKDSNLVDESAARNVGAVGVIRLNKQSVQIVVGTQAENIAAALREVSQE
ncbi:glucose PTS transporter subunit EIIB, partial [Dickeya dianthicola]